MILTFLKRVKTVITEIDIENRRYDSKDRLVYSKIQIIEQGKADDKAFVIETDIHSYNLNDQINRMTRTIQEGTGITIERDIEDRTYDAKDRLKYSNIEVTETEIGTGITKIWTSTDIFDTPLHGLADGDVVRIDGVVNGLSSGKDYYVIKLNDNQFMLLEFQGGAMLDKLFGTKGHSAWLLPSFGVGGDRPYDFSLEVGYKIVW